MKTVLVTGASGFLGRYIVAHYHSLGWRVIGLGLHSEENAPPNLARYVRTELPSTSVGSVIQEYAPEVCMHCAGRASVEMSMADPGSDFRAGVDAVFNLLDAIRLHAPDCRLVYLSSAAVYGNPTRLPVCESDPTDPISPYGFHKLIGERLLVEFNQVYGLRTASARIFSAYGPGLRRQLMWDICRRAMTEPVITLRGTGNESRDFIHARDVASALFAIAEKAECHGEAYNLAGGVETTTMEVAEMLLASLGRPRSIEVDGVQQAGVPRNWLADVNRLRELGFTPTMSLRQGLETYANWCRAEVLGT